MLIHYTCSLAGSREHASKIGEKSEGSEKTSSESDKNGVRQKSHGRSSVDKVNLPNHGVKPSVSPDSFSDESVSSDPSKKDFEFSFQSDGSKTLPSSQPSVSAKTTTYA